MTALNKEELVYVNRLSRWVARLKNETAGTLSVEMIQALLIVAEHPGISVVEIAERMGSSRGTASRQLLDLGIKRRSQTAPEGHCDGFRLVEAFIDPNDLRLRRYRCTTRGYALARQLAQLMSAPVGGGGKAGVQH